MAIYGTALLSICLLVGLIVGRLLGALVGVDANVGGVGIAMLLLILICDRLHQSGRMQPPTKQLSVTNCGQGFCHLCSQNDTRLATGVERAISKRDALCGLYRTCRPPASAGFQATFHSQIRSWPGFTCRLTLLNPSQKKKGVE